VYPTFKGVDYAEFSVAISDHRRKEPESEPRSYGSLFKSGNPLFKSGNPGKFSHQLHPIKEICLGEGGTDE
jgi:hypothetical protein